MRRRVIAELRRGPASATTVAAALGENTGATSCHLRELAKHGFIEDDPELGRGKERWWRLVQRDLRFPRRSEQSPELAAVPDRLRDAQFTEDLATWARFQERQEELGDWADAVPFSRGSLVVTQDELKTFFEDYLALLKRHWRAPTTGTSAATRSASAATPPRTVTASRSRIPTCLGRHRICGCGSRS